MWWQDCAVVFHPGQFPDTVEYPTARPAMTLRELGVPVHVVEVLEAPRPTHREVEGVTRWSEVSRFGALMRIARLRPRLLLTDGSTWPLLALPLARHSWVRAVNHSSRAWIAAAERLLITLARYVSFTSPAEAQWWSMPDRKVVDLPYPVDIDFWSAPVERADDFWLSRDLKVPTGDVVCYAAQLMARKRQVELLQALEPLLKQRPDLVLVFAGYTAEAATEIELRKLTASAGLTDRVHLIGNLSREELRQLYRWSTVHVINSGAETQCMVLYESLAAGTATLISDLEVMTGAFPALPVHRNDEQLRSNVADLLDNPAKRATLVAGAAARLEWADVARHDASIQTVASDVFGRPSS